MRDNCCYINVCRGNRNIHIQKIKVRKCLKKYNFKTKIFPLILYISLQNWSLSFGDILILPTGHMTVHSFLMHYHEYYMHIPSLQYFSVHNDVCDRMICLYRPREAVGKSIEYLVKL